MADRYWVGGTAAWDGTAGTKWALTSNGTGGQAVPTAADDVFFDSASGANTVTVTGSRVAKSINCTGFTGTLAGASTPALTISGSLTLSAGMTVTYSGNTTFNGTGTIISAGKSFGSIAVNGAGITTTLGDAFVAPSFSLTVTQGTFNTANYNVTFSLISSTNSNTRTINLGSSTLTLGGASPIQFNNNTNLTFNAGTSQINCTTNSSTVSIEGGTISPPGVTFYNVSFTGTAAQTRSISGINTFNNLSATAPATAGVTQVTFDSRQTINGVLSTTGSAGNCRVWFRSATYGLAQTLTINGTPSLTDADFRDLYIVGTAAPISGTRIGDLRGCRGITFSTPKTVYWNLAGAQNWHANGWAATPTGTPSTDNFPLAQDTATFTNSGSVTGTITMAGELPYTGTIDMSGRTSAMTIRVLSAQTIYGDWKNGSGTTINDTAGITFSGRNIQTITSAGKTFSFPITIDSYGGSVELADALNIGGLTLTVTNGTFDTKNYNVSCGAFSSSNSNVRGIKLGSSTITLNNNLDFTTFTNLTFDSSTSTITHTASAPSPNFGTGLTFYNLSFTGTSGSITGIGGGPFTCNNLSVTAPTGSGFQSVTIAANVTINGTLTVAGASPVRRIFVQSSTLGTARTLTVNSLSATDCDFRDITIAGAAAGSSPTRAGDCGGNSGITFPAAKTVYWNLSGAQTWSATAWATGSGGTPNINNFPLAQDTAIFNEAVNSVTGTITVDKNWNIGTVDMSARTSAMTLTTSTLAPIVYGDWKFGTGVTSSSTTGTITFAKRGTQTITSNGVTFGCPVTINSVNGTVQLADALSVDSARTLTLTRGTFDAVTYNVTTGRVGLSAAAGNPTRTLKMGSGTWTLSGTGNVWGDGGFNTGGFIFYKNTANIVLSDTSTTDRNFNGGNLSYNKLTIGGATGTSTTTIADNNQFTELASTKTVAHTIALGTTAQTFGKWTVTGTVGNVVTLTGTGTSHIIAGSCTSGIDYLAMGSIGFSNTSPGEFYAGANSTGTAPAPVYRTAKPADSTRYWVGGTGNWSDTLRWSTTSGSGSGASVPRSHDDVVFNSGSNATAYTATVDAVTGGIRCKSLTIAGPASGNLTLAGSANIVGIHNNVTLPATGLTRTYSGSITLTGNTTGKIITTNGIILASNIIVNGVDCEWSLGSGLNVGSSSITITNGTFNLANYNLTASSVASDNANSRTINFGSGTITLDINGTAINFGTVEQNRAALTVNTSTSQINISGATTSFSGNNQTFYNVSFTSSNTGSITLTGTNSFNNLSYTGLTSSGIKNIIFSANQTVTGTLTVSAGTNATMRHFCQSNIIGTTCTITAAAVSMTDVDFRDITIAGAAAPAGGTRIGDCKGNSGITFTAAKTVYWNLAAGGDISGTGWATTRSGTPAVNNFPLAQDTMIVEDNGLGIPGTLTVNAAYNLGTLDLSGRTGATTFTISTNPFIYGNWTIGSGVTISGSGSPTWAGRTLQTVTSSGKTFTHDFIIDSPGGTVRLLDAYTNNRSSTSVLQLTSGTFDANGYNVTLSGTTNARVLSNNSNTRTLAIGSGTWTIASSGVVWDTTTTTNLTVTGSGIISLTNAAAKTFTGGSYNYGGITLNQAGTGDLTISGNNTFQDITNSAKASGATSIAFGSTIQRLSQFTAAGDAGRLLTISGTSAGSPATLIITGSGVVNSDNLVISNIRAYNLTDTWYAGNNSTNNGTLGWTFSVAPTATTFFAFL